MVRLEACPAALPVVMGRSRPCDGSRRSCECCVHLGGDPTALPGAQLPSGREPPRKPGGGGAPLGKERAGKAATAGAAAGRRECQEARGADGAESLGWRLVVDSTLLPQQHGMTRAPPLTLPRLPDPVRVSRQEEKHPQGGAAALLPSGARASRLLVCQKDLPVDARATDSQWRAEPLAPRPCPRPLNAPKCTRFNKLEGRLSYSEWPRRAARRFPPSSLTTV